MLEALPLSFPGSEPRFDTARCGMPAERFFHSTVVCRTNVADKAHEFPGPLSHYSLLRYTSVIQSVLAHQKSPPFYSLMMVSLNQDVGLMRLKTDPTMFNGLAPLRLADPGTASPSENNERRHFYSPQYGHVTVKPPDINRLLTYKEEGRLHRSRWNCC